MKRVCLFVLTILLIPLSLSAQDDSYLGAGIQTAYRAMLSSTNASDESGSDHSFYGSGTGFGIGIRLNF